MSRSEIRARLDSIIEFAELGEFIDQRVRTYSSGMYMRLAFSVATHVDPEILIVDEILAVGDEHFRRKSAAKLREFKSSGRTILLVTHDLGSVRSWCDSAAWIDGGGLREFGEPAGVVERYQEALQLAEAEQAVQGAGAALSAPGRALPQLADAPRQQSPARVQVFRADGSVDAGIRPDEPFAVCVEFQAPEAGAELAVKLQDAGGRTLFEAVLRGPWPRASEANAVAWLHVERCGLVDGDYGVVAALTAQGHEPGMTVADRPLKVRGGDAAHRGLVRMPHRWAVDGQLPPVREGAAEVA